MKQCYELGICYLKGGSTQTIESFDDLNEAISAAIELSKDYPDADDVFVDCWDYDEELDYYEPNDRFRALRFSGGEQIKE